MLLGIHLIKPVAISDVVNFLLDFRSNQYVK